ncbi:hypothetical protein KCU71_g2693, partial [Aureobasidium melanogenum]
MARRRISPTNEQTRPSTIRERSVAISPSPPTMLPATGREQHNLMSVPAGGDDADIETLADDTDTETLADDTDTETLADDTDTQTLDAGIVRNSGAPMSSHAAHRLIDHQMSSHNERAHTDLETLDGYETSSPVLPNQIDALTSPMGRISTHMAVEHSRDCSRSVRSSTPVNVSPAVWELHMTAATNRSLDSTPYRSINAARRRTHIPTANSALRHTHASTTSTRRRQMPRFGAGITRNRRPTAMQPTLELGRHDFELLGVFVRVVLRGTASVSELFKLPFLLHR